VSSVGHVSTPSAPRAPYPRDREADVVLRDGSTLHVRPVRAADEAALRAFFTALSEESMLYRFFGRANIDWATSWALDVDYADRFALVAVSGAKHTIVAHAAYIRTGRDRAEVAFVVSDAWQGHGIATILLAQLAAAAQEHGISTFTSVVLPVNHRMIEVFRESGFPVDTRSAPGVITIELPTSLSDDAIARFEERERIAAVAAVRSVLEPRSVALIGASRRRGTVGSELLHNLIAGGYGGEMYAVNDRADGVQGRPAYRSVTELPGPVELAVVAVPAEAVLQVARDCAPGGVRALLVISAGFAEIGGEGSRRQRELIAACRDAGIRLVGPNCLGVLNTASDVRLNATFAPHPALPGRIGFLSQSGGLGVAIIEAAGRFEVGLSSFVSIGNKADVSANDLLRYWEQDPGTDVVLLYLESFGNPRKFARIARRVARQKPVVAVKSGRSPAGTRATSSHTGALLSASDVTVDALFEQAGVIRTDTLHELLDVAALLAKQPVPRGARVAIVTNAGGPAIMCADTCQSNGVDVPQLPAAVKRRLGAFLPREASLGNPVDMTATASAEDYRRTMHTLVEAGICDAILTIFVPSLVTRASDVAVAIRDAGAAAAAVGVTFAAVFMTSERIPAELASDGAAVPGYEFPEDAARALALAARYGRWRTRPQGTPFEPTNTRPAEAAAILSEALAAGSGWLAPAHVVALLDCYGLPMIETRVVSGSETAAAAAAQMDRPVALKAVAPGLVHKSDVGAVRLGLEDPQAVRDAAREIEAAVARAGRRLEGLIVQPMAPSGVELIVGVVNDHNFGPVLACGAGGTTAELVKDVAVRITPITDLDAREMLQSLRTYPMLEGYRGAPGCDLAAVEDVLLRVGAMVEAHPEIVELDCNPLIAAPQHVLIADARVRVQAAPPPTPMAALSA
jgi:acetyl coenzyme A synthetase (ADP forming)-like protein